MESESAFLFVNWPTTSVEIAGKLTPLLCVNGAGLYFVEHTANGLHKEVRVGWPGQRGNKILAIMRPEREMLRLELRVGESSGVIGNGGMEPDLSDSSKLGQKSQKAKGIKILDIDLHKDIKKWVAAALKFTWEEYGLATQS